MIAQTISSGAMLAWQIVCFAIGLMIVLLTINSAIHAFVLPRSERVALQRFVFRATLIVFLLRLRRAKSYEDRDRIMASYAPFSLLLIPVVCLLLILLGYTAMFWAVGVTPLQEAFILSGSSLFTLGFKLESAPPHILLTYSEATIGLGLVALIISYLPTMYSAFSSRESMVAMLEVRAGSPPSAVEVLQRYHRLQNWDSINQFFSDWERWFASLEETHTSLIALVFFRSPQPERHWVTAAGAVLDSAALYHACLVQEMRDGYQAAFCIRAGYIALRRIADFFQLDYDPVPAPDAPISISFEEFAQAYNGFIEEGLIVARPLEDAWKAYAGWRVNYDSVLIQLASLTFAPYAPWSSDRSLSNGARLYDGYFGRIRRTILGG